MPAVLLMREACERVFRGMGAEELEGGGRVEEEEGAEEEGEEEEPESLGADAEDATKADLARREGGGEGGAEGGGGEVG